MNPKNLTERERERSHTDSKDKKFKCPHSYFIIQHFKPIEEESSSREREREDEARVVVDDRDRVDFRGGIERVHGVQKEEGRIKGEKSEETHVRKKVVTEEGRY